MSLNADATEHSGIGGRREVQTTGAGRTGISKRSRRPLLQRRLGSVRRRRLLFSFSPPARFPWHLFLGLPGLPAFAAAMVERGQQDGDGIQPAVPFRFRRGTPEAFNEAIDDSEVRKRQVPSLAQRPKFPAAPRNHYIAALERAPKIPDAQTQHGANDGGDGAAIGLVPRLVLEPQIGSDGPKERLFSAAAVAKPSLADQADTEQRA